MERVATHDTAAPGGDDRSAALFVGAVFLAMTCATFAFVERHADDIPHYDEWSLVPYLSGERPVTWRTFWEQHNEHRFVLPRLIYFSLFHLTGGFRAGVLFNVFLLAALSLAMILAARRARGSSRYSDAVFPLLFLNWGHGENFIMSYQIGFVLPVALCCCVLMVIILHPAGMSRWGAGVAALCLAALPLCGAMGVVLAPALATWCAVVAVRSWRGGAPHGRACAWLLSVGIAATAAIVAAYFARYVRPPHHPSSPGLSASLLTTWKVVTTLTGASVAQRFWPYSGVVAALVAVMTALALAFRQQSPKVDRLGLVLFLAATGLLAASIGHGRASFPTLHFNARYLLLLVPMLCCAYWVWELWPVRTGPAVQMAVFTLVCLTTPWNCDFGMGFLGSVSSPSRAFQADLLAGVPRAELAERHRLPSYPFTPQQFASDLARLRAGRVGIFRHLKESPAPESARSGPAAP